MQQHKIERVHLVLTRTIVRLRDEIHQIEKLDVPQDIKQALINQHYILVDELERDRSEVMNILWS